MMSRLQKPFRAACLALLAACMPAAADVWGDYANAWLGDQLRRERPDRFWTDLVARPSGSAGYPASGPRTWEPAQENPWANTYGTPEGSRWRPMAVQPYFPGVVRMCSCYLPADARSWDGGPLTPADVTRLCRAQCY